ncbi:MAG: hypothetical protein J6W92_01225 [Paludibacteraceae bacterium]|nr:hypothetical protein [Paludibacteraceae bacterium]MBP5641673.1 hypothetical protein [Paludibacteraceae bacterium]
MEENLYTIVLAAIAPAVVLLVGFYVFCWKLMRYGRRNIAERLVADKKASENANLFA